MTQPENLFLCLIELEKQNAVCVFNSLTDIFNKFGLTEDLLAECLVSLTCDGAAVMLGRKSGVAKLFLDKFPNIIVWHCLNHRLELCVGDTVKEINGMNNMKIFIDKVHSIYHSSPKNQRELQICSRSLEHAILRIGKILDTRWVSSSLRTMKALRTDYTVLFKHFSQASVDMKRDAKERAMFLGLSLRLSSTALVQNLGLMYDALQELSELSLKLEKRSCTIVEAHREISLQIRVFEAMVDRPGKYLSEALSAIEINNFQGVILHAGKKSDVPIPVGQFYRSLANNLRNRMFVIGSNDPEESTKLMNQFKVLYPQFWPDEVDLSYGELEISLLARRFKLDDRPIIRDFRVFKDTAGKEVLCGMRQIITATSTIPVSSAECERGFSIMNLILTPTRTSMLTKTLSNLMFLKLVGPPLMKFNPTAYVRSWLASGRHNARDARSKQRKPKEDDKNRLALWDLF